MDPNYVEPEPPRYPFAVNKKMVETALHPYPRVQVVAGFSLIGVTCIQIVVNLMILSKDIWKDLKKSWLGSKLRLSLCGAD
jgi:hypothetical protein